jgi:uncharacterized membrane protein
MQALIDHLKAWQLHPFIDHFTVAILVVAVLADLVGSLLPNRFWIRHMALTLLIVGTIAAFGSKLTGGWDADKVWDSLPQPAKEILHWHCAIFGKYLPYAFAVLVLWRLLIHFTGFGARTRPIYLALAIIVTGFLLYQGYLGGELVYDYGAGTALLQAAAPSPSPAAESSSPVSASPIPTVFVPPSTPTPAASPSPVAAAVTPSGTPAASPSPAESNPAPTEGSSTKNL